METFKDEEPSEECASTIKRPDPEFESLSDDAKIMSLRLQSAKLQEEYKRSKAQLAKENQKFQHLTDRRMTEQALLNQNANSIDNMFSIVSNGGYRYQGTNECCFDDMATTGCHKITKRLVVPCKHELCARAKTTGVSWIELETLKYYNLRIQYEKTQRKKGALEKQRDVELARLKKNADEEVAVQARRLQKSEKTTIVDAVELSATQGLDTIIFKAKIARMYIYKREMFEDLRKAILADLKICTDEMNRLQLQLVERDPGGDLEKHLPEILRTVELLQRQADWYAEKITEAAIACKSSPRPSDRSARSTARAAFTEFDSTDSDAVELFDSVGKLMEELDLPTESFDSLENIQAIIGKVTSLPENEKSPALRQILDQMSKLVLRNQKRHSLKEVSASQSDCISLTSQLHDVRELVQWRLMEQGASAGVGDSTTPWAELVLLEGLAYEEMYESYERLLGISVADLATSFLSIKQKTAAKSIMPRLTEVMLDVMGAPLLSIANAMVIFRDLDEISDHIVDAKISGMVFTQAEKKAKWLLEAYTATEATLEAAYNKPLPLRIQNALQRVKIPVAKRWEAQAVKAADTALARTEKRISGHAEIYSVCKSGNVLVNKVADQSSSSLHRVHGPSMTREQSISDSSEKFGAPCAMVASIIPGAPRRKLLPRGQRHLDSYETMVTTAKVAHMSQRTAKKMSDFCVLQQKAYKRAGLPLPANIRDGITFARREADEEPNISIQEALGCRCSRGAETDGKPTEKSSKFAENFSDRCRDNSGVTLDGRLITVAEHNAYANSTIKRIRSIAKGEAKLEYLCWIAFRISLEADAAQTAKEDWRVPILRFEEFFVQHAPVPRALELALDYALGKLWQSPDCRVNYPQVDWPLIDQILIIMRNIRSNQLAFAFQESSWRIESQGFSNKENDLRKGQLNLIKTDSEQAPREEQYAQLKSPGVQLESRRLKDATSPELLRDNSEEALRFRFAAHGMSADRLLDTLVPISGEYLENGHVDDNPHMDLAFSVQMQAFDCMRMAQLIAESRGWAKMAKAIDSALKDVAVEDENGHYPDYWIKSDASDDDVSQDREVEKDAEVVARPIVDEYAVSGQRTDHTECCLRSSRSDVD